MRSLLLALALVLISSGCTQTRPLGDPTPDRHAALNARFSGRIATVALRSGSTFEAQSVRLHADSLSWVWPATRDTGATAQCRVASITVLRQGRGVAEGAGLGLVIGAGLGATVLFAAVYLDPPDDGIFIGVAGIAAVGAVLGGILGTPLGAVAGGVRGHGERYAFAPCGR